MNNKYLRRIGGFILTLFLLSGIAMTASNTAQAQGRRRVIIVRPYPVYRPFWGYRSWYGYPYGYDRFGYPYSYYGHYVFSNTESAVNQGYHDGYDTGRKDGKKSKSYNPERSHYFHDAGFGNFAEAYRGAFMRGYRDGYSAGRSA